MPTIDTKQRRIFEAPQKKHASKKSNLIHKHVYNTQRWQLLRINYLSSHSLCEEHIKRGRAVPATDVHHIIEISTAKDIESMKRLGFDERNLMSLCKECHYNKHHGEKNF